MLELTDREFSTIRDYIKNHYGISLSDEKKSLVYSRLRNVVTDMGFDSFSAYFEYLMKDKSGESIVMFINKVTTNHTFFMREADHFDYFADTVLPFVSEKHKNDKDLALWCACCSSGEESYTLAMIVADFFRDKPGWNTQMLATDISEQVLDRAVRGVYPNDSLKPIPENWKRNYLKPLDSGFSVIKDEIKKQIIFRKFNLMQEKYQFRRKFSVIFCRNVMIYFDNPTREAVVKRLYDATEPGGYLFIGHSESLNHIEGGYKYVKPAVYRKE